MCTDAVLDIRHYSKSYDEGRLAADDVSLRVMPGDIYGFIGHNGAGKTTVIRSVVGVLDFQEGEILVDGHSVREEPVACKRVIAYIPDNPDVYENLTGIQYLNFVADAFGLGARERTAEIARYADLFEITDVLGDLIGSYSHGMRQKLVVVSALIHHPKLMVLDEPFVGLDPKATYTVKELMREMCREGGAVFFSTHVLDVAERLCNRIAIIRRGKIVAAGPTSELTGGHSLEETFLEALDA
jgi:ABC-2 type transport system ATP-binding protein